MDDCVSSMGLVVPDHLDSGLRGPLPQYPELVYWPEGVGGPGLTTR